MRNVITGGGGPWSRATGNRAEGCGEGTVLHLGTVARAHGDAICRAQDAVGRCP